MRNIKQYWEEANRAWSEDSLWLSNTAAPDTKQVFFYVQETGYFRTTPPYYTERANLDSFLLFYTIRGNGILTYRDAVYTLEPGSVAWIHCMDYHHYRCAQQGEWEFLWLHFNGPSALGYFRQFVKNGFYICRGQDEAFFTDTMTRILVLTREKGKNSEILLSELITSLLTQLLITGSGEAQSAGNMPGYLKQVIKKIDTQFTGGISLDQLSREFGVSKYHLAREFKRYTGVTINDYWTITRLNYAKELLKYTGQTVEQVAYASGFHHVSHFINVFKAHEAVTPLQFRKEWGETPRQSADNAPMT